LRPLLSVDFYKNERPARFMLLAIMLLDGGFPSRDREIRSGGAGAGSTSEGSSSSLWSFANWPVVFYLADYIRGGRSLWFKKGMSGCLSPLILIGLVCGPDDS